MTRIAIVDDSPIDRSYMAACVRKGGWMADPLAVHDTFALIDLLLKNPPDLLILDYMLPQLKGDALAEILRRNPSLKEVPILVVTAHQDPDLMKRLLALGVREVLHKPVKHSTLIHAVRRHLPG